MLEITRWERPLVAASDFERYSTFVRLGFGTRPDAPQLGLNDWVSEFRTRR